MINLGFFLRYFVNRAPVSQMLPTNIAATIRTAIVD